MQLNKLKLSLAKWWFAPQFPMYQFEKILAYKPEGVSKTVNNLFRTWLIHPIKRRIAKYYLMFLRNFFNLKVIGITGSAGKTTTKEMLASILKQRGETIFS